TGSGFGGRPCAASVDARVGHISVMEETKQPGRKRVYQDANQGGGIGGPTSVNNGSGFLSGVQPAADCAYGCNSSDEDLRPAPLGSARLFLRRSADDLAMRELWGGVGRSERAEGCFFLCRDQGKQAGRGSAAGPGRGRLGAGRQARSPLYPAI